MLVGLMFSFSTSRKIVSLSFDLRAFNCGFSAPFVFWLLSSFIRQADDECFFYFFGRGMCEIGIMAVVDGGLCFHVRLVIMSPEIGGNKFLAPLCFTLFGCEQCYENRIGPSG